MCTGRDVLKGKAYDSCVCVRMCVYVFVCVGERERKRETKKDRKNEVGVFSLWFLLSSLFCLFLSALLSFSLSLSPPLSFSLAFLSLPPSLPLILLSFACSFLSPLLLSLARSLLLSLASSLSIFVLALSRSLAHAYARVLAEVHVVECHATHTHNPNKHVYITGMPLYTEHGKPRTEKIVLQTITTAEISTIFHGQIWISKYLSSISSVSGTIIRTYQHTT